MTQFNRILAVADSAMEKTTAIARGGALAKRTGAELDVLLVDYHPALEASAVLDMHTLERAREAYMQHRRQWLLREAGELIHEKVGVRTDAVWGHPADEVIIAEAIARKADLVVKEVTSESQLQRLLFSSSDWQLARNCPVPVMLVNEHSSSYPQRILVALDVFDEHGKPASLNHELIRNALGVAYQCDAQVHVIHVFDPTPLELAVPGVDQLPYDHELLEKVRDDHRVALTAFAEEYGIPEDRLHFLEGNTDLALSETVARLHADLLVMGAVKRSVIGRLFVGSTTERVLGRVDCDLLLVKAPAVADEIIEEHEERIRHLESSSRKRAG